MANARARAFRRNPTSGEQAAWRILRVMRREGVHVRRQHPVGKYIADFAILKARLAIEIDGGVHQLDQARDKIRDQAFATLGWNVLRIDAKFSAAPTRLLDLVRAKLLDMQMYPLPSGWDQFPGAKVQRPPINVERHPTPSASPPTLPSRGG